MIQQKTREEDEERRKDSFTIEGPFGLKGKFRGLNVLVGLALVVLSVLSTILYFHMQDERSVLVALKEVAKSTRELTYVITLPQDKREGLHMDMPESLRSRLKNE